MVAAKSLPETFDVFEDPYNLAKITPPWLHFEVTSKTRVQMRKGAEISYRIQWLGMPMGWKTVISEYQPPLLFVDEQASGPYTLWRHRHTFEASEQGTRVKDQVEYALPLGPLGALAHSLLVRWQVLGIFQYRQEQLGKIFGSGTRQTIPPTIVSEC
jgi:ligand-binding SRPBCC domain-containing protein